MSLVAVGSGSEQPHPDSARLAPSHPTGVTHPLSTAKRFPNRLSSLWRLDSRRGEAPGPQARAVAEGIYLVSLERCVVALRARARARTSSGTAWSWRAWSLATIRVTACPAASRYW
jgi:hypothetical protein